MSEYRGAIPDGQYGCIVADPPWPWNYLERKTPDAWLRRNIGLQTFDLMTIEEIEAMGPRIREVAAPKSHLWLWCINQVILNGYAKRTLDAWGFVPRQLVTWDKEIVGLGWWLRSQTEQLILATREGATARVNPRKLSTLLREKRRRHAQKPESFWQYPERLSPEPRLELFSREPRAGWTCVVADGAAGTLAFKKFRDQTWDSARKRKESGESVGGDVEHGADPPDATMSITDRSGGDDQEAAGPLPHTHAGTDCFDPDCPVRK
jgi:N6-adenosine-specific RNA methylase IME4